MIASKDRPRLPWAVLARPLLHRTARPAGTPEEIGQHDVSVRRGESARPYGGAVDEKDIAAALRGCGAATPVRRRWYGGEIGSRRLAAAPSLRWNVSRTVAVRFLRRAKAACYLDHPSGHATDNRACGLRDFVTAEIRGFRGSARLYIKNSSVLAVAGRAGAVI